MHSVFLSLLSCCANNILSLCVCMCVCVLLLPFVGYALRNFFAADARCHLMRCAASLRRCSRAIHHKKYVIPTQYSLTPCLLLCPTVLCPTPCIGRSLRHIYMYILVSLLPLRLVGGGATAADCDASQCLAGASSNGPPNEALPRTVGKLCELIWNSSKCRISFWQLQQTGNAACSPNSSIYLAWRGSRDRCTAAIHLSLSASLTCSPPPPLPLSLSCSRMYVKHIKIIFFFARQNARWQLPHTLPVEESAPPPTFPPLSLSLSVNFHISVAASWQTATSRRQRRHRCHRVASNWPTFGLISFSLSPSLSLSL